MIKAVVFDLDNTLVTSNINFQQLRMELACPADKDLLTHVDETFCDNERQQRIETILKHELDDAKASDLMAGARSLTDWLSNEGLKFGIITRNCREAAKKKLSAHALTIEELITREDFPAKPDPSALLHLVDKWQLEQHNVLYVGDHQYDILTAQNAGCLSALFPTQVKQQTPSVQTCITHHWMGFLPICKKVICKKAICKKAICRKLSLSNDSQIE